MGESLEEEGRQGKVEVTIERDADFTIHLAEGPLHDVTCWLHYILQVLWCGGKERPRQFNYTLLHNGTL